MYLSLGCNWEHFEFLREHYEDLVHDRVRFSEKLPRMLRLSRFWAWNDVTSSLDVNVRANRSRRGTIGNDLALLLERLLSGQLNRPG